MSSPLLTIDVAHPPRHPARVEEALMDAYATVRNSSVYRIIKVIHGYGSSGRGGSTRDVVRNWAFRMGDRFREVIPGEEYSLFHAKTQKLRASVGDYIDPDLGAENKGVTYVWVK